MTQDVHDLVRDLTQRHTHHERFQVRRGTTWYSEKHVTDVPALITQLQHATPSGSGEERGNAGFASRPAARIEALDTLIRIDHEASRWLRILGEDDPADTITVIRRLNARAASAEPETRAAIEKDIRRWWTQARIVTGWDAPAWRPENTCPLCEKRGGLRVKVVDQVGHCTECGESWTPATLPLLADHIRAENADEQAS